MVLQLRNTPTAWKVTCPQRVKIRRRAGSLDGLGLDLVHLFDGNFFDSVCHLEVLEQKYNCLVKILLKDGVRGEQSGLTRKMLALWRYAVIVVAFPSPSKFPMPIMMGLILGPLKCQ